MRLKIERAAAVLLAAISLCAVFSVTPAFADHCYDGSIHISTGECIYPYPPEGPDEPKYCWQDPKCLDDMYKDILDWYIRGLNPFN